MTIYDYVCTLHCDSFAQKGGNCFWNLALRTKALPLASYSGKDCGLRNVPATRTLQRWIEQSGLSFWLETLWPILGEVFQGEAQPRRV